MDRGVAKIDGEKVLTDPCMPVRAPQLGRASRIEDSLADVSRPPTLDKN